LATLSATAHHPVGHANNDDGTGASRDLVTSPGSVQNAAVGSPLVNRTVNPLPLPCAIGNAKSNR
jgi:hypothetical protein